MSRSARKKHRISLFFTLISNLLLIAGSGYLIYNISLLNNIENDLRLIGSIILGILCLILFLFSVRFYKRHKLIKLTFLAIFMLIIGGVSGFAGYNVDKVYGTLSKISDTSGYTVYSSSVVTLADNKVSSIDEIGDEEIGIIADDTSIDGYVIPQEIIEKEGLSNKLKEYASFISVIDALYSGEVKYAFLPSNYSVMFGSMEGYTDINEKIKTIYSKKKKVKSNTSYSSNKGKSITEPFTILLMGVDSEVEGIRGSSFNGDSLMLITFNPKTLSTTMLSIPRDSYVPISCFANKKKNKITHAAWQGESCMMNTIQNLLDVNIDYFVKINFKGVVQLVDALGGVEIDVPYNMCEQDSNRAWGEDTVYIEKGLQTLNGEQALAYSRNRHPNPDKCSAKWTNYNSDDFVRGEHQQEVVGALLNKFKSIKDLSTVYKLLDTLSNNMVTNMSTDQILSLYNVFKDVASRSDGLSEMKDVLGIQRLQLNGFGVRIVDYGGSNLSLYNYVLYNASVKACSNAMKENLGLKSVKAIKSFSFDANTPYEKEVIGGKVTDNTSIVFVPDFTGQSVSYVQSWCSSHGISVTVNGGNGSVTSQSVPSGANVEDVRSITITAGSTEKKEEKKEEVTCGSNASYNSSSKKCVCNDGYEKDSNGNCVKEKTEPDTPETPEEPEEPEENEEE